MRVEFHFIETVSTKSLNKAYAKQATIPRISIPVEDNCGEQQRFPLVSRDKLRSL